MKTWLILLAVWFLLWGLLAVTNFKFEQANLIMGVLAVAIGIMIFVAERKATP